VRDALQARLLCDTITGSDTIIGGVGDDTLTGASGNDTLNGGVGDNNLYGGADPDIVNGDAASDSLTGRPNDLSMDRVNGGLGTDVCQGPGPDGDILTGCPPATSCEPKAYERPLTSACG
jgi:Ca2+-binding RTX toxin-like protein